MSIIRLHKSQWEAVPRAPFENAKLSLQTRGLLAWFLTRPKNWHIRVAAMLQLTGCSEYLWQKVISPQLREAGYLHVEQTKKGGRWVWNYDVYSIPQSPRPKIVTYRKTKRDEEQDKYKHTGNDTDINDTSPQTDNGSASHTRGAAPRSDAAPLRASKAGVTLNVEEEARFQHLLTTSNFDCWLLDGYSTYWVTRQKNELRRRFKDGEDIVQIIDLVVDNNYHSFEGAHL